MYVRQPDPNRPRVKIPENYSGHAFRGESSYSDMPPPARIDLPTPQRPLEPTEESGFPEKEPLDMSTGLSEDHEGHEIALSKPESKQQESKPSLFSSLLPTNFASSDHFPFGHGIGSEEILIIAMMLMVFLSERNGDEPDHELLILLGLLLFAG